MLRHYSANPYANQFGKVLKCGVSVIALCALTAPAMAQDAAGSGAAANVAAPTDGAPAASEITITGIRASLANSQNIKRNSDTVVDAITASDIGALPDRSVTEALQRVPGVAINRFAGSNDPDHFSGEGSGVVVRGLTFVRSEFNGRDTFSAGVGGQAINFADVPAELLGSVEVYKNATAEMIEGGLAGTVNLNTRKPFDSKGFHIGFDVEGGYGDLAKHWSPTYSGLISDTWDTDIGRVGLLAAMSYSQVRYRPDGLNVTNVQTRDNQLVVQSNSTTTLVCRNPLPGTTDTTTLPPPGSDCGAASTAGADGFADPANLRYAPVGGQFREEDHNHKRKGVSLAAQWESLDRRALLTAQFLHTASNNNWGEHTFETGPDLAEYNTYPKGCLQNGDGPASTQVRAECPVGQFQNYTYDENGLFESGYITYPGSGWRNSSSGSTDTRVPTGGQQQSLSRRQVSEQNRVTDYGMHFKFAPNDRWTIDLDGDYTKAEHNSLDVSVFGSTFADNELDISGNLAQIIPHKPLTLAAGWATPNPIVAAQNDQQYFADRSNQFWRAAMDHIEHSTGDEYALKADIAYNFGGDDPFLKRLKFGARYSDREETVRYTTYNWGALSEVWAGQQVSFNQIQNNSGLYTYNNFFRGDAAGPPAAYYYNGNLTRDYQGAVNQFKQIGATWQAQGGGTPWTPAGERAGVVAGGPYLPSEIQPISQKTKNAYVMLSFGRDEPLFGNIKLDGNIGVRYVGDDITSTGSLGAPTQAALGVVDPFSVRCPPPTPPAGSPPGTPPRVPTGVCALGAANYANLQKFANGATVADVAKNKYHYFLPSLNLRFGITRDLIMRFAASRVMTRPDLANIRNYVTLGLSSDGSGLSANAGNPYLKPALANQFDVTAEWYFARVGSLTIDAFYKDITNFFYSNIFNRSITNEGVTLSTQVRGPDNYTGHGKIKGVEVAYQQTYDFLPGLLSGLGTSVSYTYLQSKGLPNSFLNGGATSSTSPVPAGSLPLEQLSKHNFNAEVFYEKGPISLRVAYTWRSKFLLTAADVIFPYYPIFNAAGGSLDGSAFFSVTKNVKVGVQGVNLNKQVTKTLQQFTPGLLAPRSYFTQDRRFSFIVRGSF